jgi:exonuclease SbcD
MRLLHTSDWHVGRTFHGQDLLTDQEAVLGGLAALVERERVDVVLVAGDLYDRAVPSAEAVAVCTRVLARLRRAGAEIIVTAGNHDSAARMGAFAEFASAGGLHLRTRAVEACEPVELADEHGTVMIYGIPYLEPELARRSFGVEEKSHTAVLTEAMRRIRDDLAERDARSVVLAHAFVTGAEPSESERTIAVGGVEQVPGAVFDGVDYVALGHLHGPQTLSPRLRYSGSPVAYSFSEAAQHKSVWLIDLEADGLGEVRREMLPVPRALATVSGALAELLEDDRFEEFREHYLSVTLLDPVRPVDPMRKLRTRFPHAVRLDWSPSESTSSKPRFTEVVRGRDDGQLADAFIEYCRGDELAASERDLVDAAFTSVRQEVD